MAIVVAFCGDWRRCTKGGLTENEQETLSSLQRKIQKLVFKPQKSVESISRTEQRTYFLSASPNTLQESKDTSQRRLCLLHRQCYTEIKLYPTTPTRLIVRHQGLEVGKLDKGVAVCTAVVVVQIWTLSAET